MNQEHVRVQINQALDLLQLITEDMEENFIGAATDNDVKAKAGMSISALYILSDYLRSIGKEGG
ncbi:hypothetical protein [uncultured Oscillibacter sp.]|uniref:hypothetical protein n=1 Tax=uncultured Oscillibacter sp. TaxID=876091 RepID=UPI0026031A45|nr:hypothetical protein [uncultured Oscillibacter sp.]